MALTARGLHWKCWQRAGLAVSLSLSLCSQGAAQAVLPTPAEQRAAVDQMYPELGAGCKTSVMTTYDTRGFWFPGSIRVCQHSIEDASTGVYVPLPGQRPFFIDGRARHGSLYMLVRGYSNTSYRFLRPEHISWESFVPQKPSTFRDMINTLPFVPFSLYSFQEYGDTYYAYGGLKILPGHEAQAYPLNSNSAIVRVDGAYFASPDSLMTMMSFDIRADNPYVEVQYVQLNERPQILRSAFIPLLSLSEAGPAWSSLTASSHVADVDSSGHFLAQIGAAAALITFILSGREFRGNRCLASTRERMSKGTTNSLLCLMLRDSFTYRNMQTVA
jgi:hypothetical protein